MIRTLTLAISSVVVVAVLAGGCSSCSKKDEAPAKPARVTPLDQPLPSGPPKGTDADNKKIAAQELATRIDGALATFQHEEKDLPADVSAVGKKAEAWSVPGKPPLPRKLVIKTVDDKGTVVDTTDYYFDDRGMVQYVRAHDGFFVFQNEGLAVWLDREQHVKRSVNPGIASVRVEGLKKEMTQALTMFKLR